MLLTKICISDVVTERVVTMEEVIIVEVPTSDPGMTIIISTSLAMLNVLTLLTGILIGGLAVKHCLRQRRAVHQPLPPPPTQPAVPLYEDVDILPMGTTIYGNSNAMATTIEDTTMEETRETTATFSMGDTITSSMIVMEENTAYGQKIEL